MNDDDKHKLANESDQSGNEDEAGSMADLESDDNALDAAQKMGLYNKADEEHPVEVGIGEEINKAEKDRQTND